jgi:hypothetical protein
MICDHEAVSFQGCVESRLRWATWMRRMLENLTDISEKLFNEKVWPDHKKRSHQNCKLCGLHTKWYQIHGEEFKHDLKMIYCRGEFFLWIYWQIFRSESEWPSLEYLCWSPIFHCFSSGFWDKHSFVLYSSYIPS